MSDNNKRITIVRAGGTASAEVEISPEDTVEQVCVLAAPELGLPAEGSYQLLGSDGNPITGNIYKAVNPGDKLILAPIGQGG